MKLINTALKTTILTLLLSSNIFADCSYELFSISSTKNTKIIDFVEQLSDECDFTIIVTDDHAKKFLNSKLQKTNLNNLTIEEVFNIILTENNLSYTLENNLLKISYLKTRMFSIDYILSQRKSEGSTDITLSSQSAATSGTSGGTSGGTSSGSGGTTGGATGASGGGSNSLSGIKIESTDEVQFWNELDLELQKVLNRPHDTYKAPAPIINKNAGIITVTATVRQLTRLEKYLKNLQSKVQLQVLIDVQLLSVKMAKGKTTGVDWKQLYALQDIDVSFGTGVGTGNVQNSFLTLNSSAGIKLNEVVKFLKTQGDVSSISNPKVLTLNNQPALITAGTEYFYKITSTETLAGGNTGSSSQSEQIQSVFAGVLLDITPEISDDKTITLKINPSLSETVTDISNTSGEDRTMPPDLLRRQLSSVVTVKDGNRIILGGLINTLTSIDENKVPILGDIPIISYLFKYEEKVKIVQELVIVIQPHIIKKDKRTLSLSEFGFANVSEDSIKDIMPKVRKSKHTMKEGNEL